MVFELMEYQCEVVDIHIYFWSVDDFQTKYFERWYCIYAGAPVYILILPVLVIWLINGFCFLSYIYKLISMVLKSSTSSLYIWLFIDFIYGMFNKKNYQLENILFHQYTCPKKGIPNPEENLVKECIKSCKFRMGWKLVLLHPSPRWDTFKVE